MKKAEYGEFLKSSEWKRFKESKAKRSAKRCSICAVESQAELHHLFYRWPWTAAVLSDTRWLCRACHQCAHDLVRSGKVEFAKPENHHSCFAIIKPAVKKARGFGNRNMFKKNLNRESFVRS